MYTLLYNKKNIKYNDFKTNKKMSDIILQLYYSLIWFINMLILVTCPLDGNI